MHIPHEPGQSGLYHRITPASRNPKQRKASFFFFFFLHYVSRFTVNGRLMDHLDPVLTTLTRGIPILILHIRFADRRVSGCRKDHLLIITHGIHPLGIPRDGQRVPELFATALVRLVGVVSVTGQGIGNVLGGAAKGREVAVRTADDATDNGVDHGDISDDDGDKGFSTGPAAGLLGTVGTGLVCQFAGHYRNGEEGLTVTIKTQRRIPAAMTKKPPLKRMTSSNFSHHGRRAFQSICTALAISIDMEAIDIPALEY